MAYPRRQDSLQHAEEPARRIHHERQYHIHGLAPLLVRDIFQIIRRINEDAGVSILVVEQNANVALRAAEYAYVMENGRIVLDGTAEQLADNADIKEFYLGLTAVGERKSYRNVKHYKRRKRWLR